MMLITDCGRRLDRQAELNALIELARITPFNRLPADERERIKHLLDLQHLERERMRWGNPNN